MQSVLFYVQHLWGVGHVYRATRIARGLVKDGFKVHLIWGGTKIDGFDFSGMEVHYLKSVRTSDVSFSELLHADGSVFTNEDKTERCDALLKLYHRINPDILMTEAFPFGRRQMRFELLPLLEKAKSSANPPMVVASIRDIMQEGRKEKRVLETNDLVVKYFDYIFVHGDENLIKIEETLQGVENFSDKIRYTGLVLPEEDEIKKDANPYCDVLVTVGGGVFGQKLTRTALQAMQYSKVFPENWILSAGTEVSENDFQLLKQKCPKGMKIVRYIPDLANVMKRVNVSVSHAGYNTVGDIIRSGCASVLYPYTDGKETEQLRRSEMMHKHKIAVMLQTEDLSPKKLAKAVDKASRLQKVSIPLQINGMSKTASLIKQSFEEFLGSAC